MNPLYNTIGATYNNTRKADPYITSRLLYHLNPGIDGHYLDLGCGTGNYTYALAMEGLNMTGIDPSEVMLRQAEMRNTDIMWLQGSAEQLPLFPRPINGIIGVLTIHHWHDLKRAFTNLHTALSGKGKIVLFTSTPRQMRMYWLNHYFPEMMARSIAQMPTLEDIEQAALPTGFKIAFTEQYAIQPNLCDHFLYTGKNDPERYFNPSIRSGISSFSSLAYKDEIEKGLLQLQSDLSAGEFDTIKQRYDNNEGDYIFVVLEKKGI